MPPRWSSRAQRFSSRSEGSRVHRLPPAAHVSPLLDVPHPNDTLRRRRGGIKIARHVSVRSAGKVDAPRAARATTRVSPSGGAALSALRNCSSSMPALASEAFPTQRGAPRLAAFARRGIPALIETNSYHATPSSLPPRTHPAAPRPSGATATAHSSALPLIKTRQRMAVMGP